MNRVVVALLLALLAMPVASLLNLASAQEVGQPIREIQYSTVTEQEKGVIVVGSGEADIFAWPLPLPRFEGISEDVLNNIVRIPAYSTFFDIALNPASNVYDSQKPGMIMLKDMNITGQPLPGLLYRDPETETQWVDISQLTPDEIAKIEFNPWGVKEIRLALNILVDRETIISQILGGSAEPMLTAVRPSHAAIEWVKDLPAQLGITSAGDPQKAADLYLDAINKLNQIYRDYGFQLVFRTDENGEERLYLVMPDGSEKKVVVNFLIRQEDERKDIGEQIATWIEEVFKIEVNRFIRTRDVVIPMFYGNNPVKTIEDLGGIAHMYTEGWVSITDDPIFWARYDAAFFYAPLRGFGPNHRITAWWYWYNETMYQLGYKLYYEAYTPQQVGELIRDVTDMVRMGLEESMRIFISNNAEYFSVNKNTVTAMFYGTTTGLWSFWGYRYAWTVDGTLRVVEFSAQGALFMSAWNPVLGFQDVYSELVWQQIHDFGLWPHPVTGIPAEIRSSIQVEINEDGIEIPETAIVYDPVMEKWVTIAEAMAANATYLLGAGRYISGETMAVSKVTFNYILGKWHDGSDFTLADVLGGYAFAMEWATDDSEVTGAPDEYFDEEYAGGIAGVLDSILAIEVINETAIAIYTDYIDVHPNLIAFQVELFPYVPIHLYAAMEWAVVNDPIEGVNLGWTTREATGEVGIDMLTADHVEAVREAAQAVAVEGIKYLNRLNEVTGMQIVKDGEVLQRLNNLIAFMDEYGNFAVSNGPFKVVFYDPVAFVIKLERVDDYPLGPYPPASVLQPTPPTPPGMLLPMPPETPTPPETETPTPTETTPPMTETTPPMTETPTTPPMTETTPPMTETTPPATETTPPETETPTETPTTPVEEETPTPTETTPPAAPPEETTPAEGGIGAATIAAIIIVIIIIAAAAFMLRRGQP